MENKHDQPKKQWNLDLSVKQEIREGRGSITGTLIRNMSDAEAGASENIQKPEHRLDLELCWLRCQEDGSASITGTISDNKAEGGKGPGNTWAVDFRLHHFPQARICILTGSAIMGMPESSKDSTNGRKEPRGQWNIDLRVKYSVDEGTCTISGGAIRKIPKPEKDDRLAIDLQMKYSVNEGAGTVTGSIGQDGHLPWAVEVCLEHSEKLGTRALCGTVTQKETAEVTKKPEMAGFFTFAEAWMKQRFGAFLGEETILGKTAAFLSTVLILYFNLLKYLYDVGYYHRAFGVPEEYLGAAWNSSMTDFVLQAMFAIVRSFFTMGMLLVFAAAVWFLFWILRQELWNRKYHHIWTEIIGRNIYRICVAILVVFVLYWLLSIKGKKLIVRIAALAGCLFFILIFRILRNTYRLSQSEGDADDGVSGLRVINWCCAVAAAVLLVLGVVFAGSVGKSIAAREQSLLMLCASEGTIGEQMDHIRNPEDKEHWAVVYQTDDAYVIMPCQIDKDTATIYSRYHSVIPSESVVVYKEVFQKLHIDDGTPHGVAGSTITDELDGFVETIIDRYIYITIEQPETPDTTEPTDTTDPTDPSTEPTGTSSDTINNTVDHTISNSSDQNMIIYIEYNVEGFRNCGCCRCEEGFG